MRETLRKLEEAAAVGHYVITVTGGKVRIEDEDNGKMVVLRSGDADPRELSRLSSMATELARNEFDEDKDLLAGYVWGDGLSKERIHSIDLPSISIGRDAKVTTTFQMTAASDLSEKEKDALANFVLGQCSDGWGEGFEQRKFEMGGVEWYVSTWNRGATAKVDKKR